MSDDECDDFDVCTDDYCAENNCVHRVIVSCEDVPVGAAGVTGEEEEARGGKAAPSDAQVRAGRDDPLDLTLGDREDAEELLPADRDIPEPRAVPEELAQEPQRDASGIGPSMCGVTGVAMWSVMFLGLAGIRTSRRGRFFHAWPCD